MVSLRINILLNCAPGALSLARGNPEKLFIKFKKMISGLLKPFTILAYIVLIDVSDYVWGLI